MHIKYTKNLENDGANKLEDTGKSFAMCVGDMAYFLSMRILSEIQPDHVSLSLQQLYSIEIAKVTAAQMQDVYGGISNKHLSQEDILSIYTYKTGRYTCGLPLVTGAIIAGATEQTIKNLWKFGIALGILFQIQDDRLNLFGDTKQTGKPVGSDIREGKQTLHRYFLLQKASSEIQSKLNAIYGNAQINEKNIQFVREQSVDLHVDKAIQSITDKQTLVINEVIEHLPIEESKKMIFHEFVEYLTHRST
jgi:geranylgeranyl diphosphate synthase type I